MDNKLFNTAKGFTLLKGGNIYDPFQSINKQNDILIKDEKIIEINKNIAKKSNYKVVDCTKCIITNGFIDLHAHFREPGFEFKENLITGSHSAFYGGYTRVCTMPNTDPVIDTPELVNYIIDKSKKLPIYIYPIGAITKGQKGEELAEIGQMVAKGAVAISDDGIPVYNSQIMRFALEYAKQFNIPVINHAEDCHLVNDGLIHEGDMSLKLGLPGNPDIAESSMVHRDLLIAEYVLGKLHIPHVSSYKSIETINNFKKKGINVTAEVTPHHLCFSDEILSNYDTNAKVAPPIRSTKDQKALVEAIKTGIIDCIATDHAPHSIEDKEKDFKNAACGMIGMESAFSLVYTTLRKEKMNIKNIIDLFTIKPSNIINITPNPICEGSIAELNVIDPNYKWKFTAKNIYSKSKNTPVIGKELIGKVVLTFNKGYISKYKT